MSKLRLRLTNLPKGTHLTNGTVRVEPNRLYIQSSLVFPSTPLPGSSFFSILAELGHHQCSQVLRPVLPGSTWPQGSATRLTVGPKSSQIQKSNKDQQIMLIGFIIRFQMFSLLEANAFNFWVPSHQVWTSLVAQRLKHLPAMQETWVQSLGWEDPLEKEMATHSSILAWRIPWTGEPGRLQSMGSQRVGDD